jgi:hypothetical protein
MKLVRTFKLIALSLAVIITGGAVATRVQVTKKHYLLPLGDTLDLTGPLLDVPYCKTHANLIWHARDGQVANVTFASWDWVVMEFSPFAYFTCTNTDQLLCIYWTDYRPLYFKIDRSRPWKPFTYTLAPGWEDSVVRASCEVTTATASDLKHIIAKLEHFRNSQKAGNTPEYQAPCYGHWRDFSPVVVEGLLHWTNGELSFFNRHQSD